MATYTLKENWVYYINWECWKKKIEDYLDLDKEYYFILQYDLYRGNFTWNLYLWTCAITITDNKETAEKLYNTSPHWFYDKMYIQWQDKFGLGLYSCTPNLYSEDDKMLNKLKQYSKMRMKKSAYTINNNRYIGKMKLKNLLEIMTDDYSVKIDF